MASLKRRARDGVNAALGRLDLAIVRRSNLDDPRIVDPTFRPPDLPAGAAEYLRSDNPRLRELESRYRGHPATESSVWSKRLVREIDLHHFRADNPYLWQWRADTHPAQYVLSASYVAEHDREHLLDRLAEDGLFGAYIVTTDRGQVSRDLLDSVLELSFLAEHAGLSSDSPMTILDVGAGYGRLGHRAGELYPNVIYMCTDAVPASTFLSEYYLGYRRSPSVVVPLDGIDDALIDRHIDLAVNIHSFAECPSDTIKWWLELLASKNVDRLFIAVTEPRLLSQEPGLGRNDFTPIVESAGYRLSVQVPKYADSAILQRVGLFPAYYFLFERR